MTERQLQLTIKEVSSVGLNCLDCHRILQAGWVVYIVGMDGVKWVHQESQKQVITTVETHPDNKHWLHVSLSKWNGQIVAPQFIMPNWDDLKDLKSTFIGPNRKAVMVFPEESRYVNIHPYCLHLYCCLDGDPLPEFSITLPDGTRSI